MNFDDASKELWPEGFRCVCGHELEAHDDYDKCYECDCESFQEAEEDYDDRGD